MINPFKTMATVQHSASFRAHVLLRHVLSLPSSYIPCVLGVSGRSVPTPCTVTAVCSGCQTGWRAATRSLASPAVPARAAWRANCCSPRPPTSSSVWVRSRKGVPHDSRDGKVHVTLTHHHQKRLRGPPLPLPLLLYGINLTVHLWEKAAYCINVQISEFNWTQHKITHVLEEIFFVFSSLTFLSFDHLLLPGGLKASNKLLSLKHINAV